MIKTEIRNIIQRRTLGLVFVLSAASIAFGQERGQAMAQQKVSVSGSVKDNANHGIGYASITFKNKSNDQLSDAVLAGVDGNFKIELAAGSYDVTIEAIDFKTKNQTIQIAKAGAIPTFVIQPTEIANLDKTTQIEGVVITAAAPKAYKIELDKKTYDPSQDIVSKGGNLQDVLSNVPSVSVDTDGTVSMRGNSNVKFLINGKPSSLLGIDDGANALQSIPADQIAKIEVITNPSSKFEASGTAGILNIILKKDKKMGFNGTITGSVGYLPRTNLNANLNWRKGNWTWYVNGGGGYTKSESTSKNYMSRKNDPSAWDYTKNDFTQISNQDGKTKRESNSYNLTAGTVYDLSDKTSINLSGMIRSFDNTSDGLNSYAEKTFYNANNFNHFLRNRNSLGDNKNFATQFDLGLDQKLDDNGQLLTISGSYQTNKTDGNTQIVQNTLLNQVLQPVGNSINNVSTNSKSDTFIGKLDYELPIGEYSKLEAGARYDYNKNTYDYFVNQSNDGGAYYTRYDFTSNTTYAENILGIYAQFKSKIGEKFAYQLGLRSETSKIDIDFLSHDLITGLPLQNPEVKKDYTKFFPSVFLSYEFAKNNQLLLNYSRRIQRPRAFTMIPFMSFDDDRNYFRGNPNLNPTYENSFEIGYAITKRKLTINPTLYYKKSEDEVNRFQYIDDKGAINTMPFNIGTETNYGLDLNGTYDPFSWWKMMLSADIYGYKNTGDMMLNGKYMDFSGDGFSYRLRLNSTFRPTKTFSFQIQSFYRGSEKTAMNNRKAMYGIDFGATQSLWKGNGTLSFNIRDIFNTRKMQNFTNTQDFVREMEMQWMPRQFSLSLSYRFRQGEKVEQPRRKKDINSNYDGGDDQSPM